MHHPLASLHTLICTDLNSQLVDGSGCGQKEESYRKACHIISGLEADILSSVLSVGGNPFSVTALVQSCQVVCTVLADKLHAYQGEREENWKVRYETLENGLLGLLGYLQQHFSSSFDSSRPVPLSVWKERKKELAAEKEWLGAAPALAALPVEEKGWVLKPLTDTLALTTETPSYNTLAYLAGYVSHWRNNAGSPVLSATEAMHHFVELNYNDPAFIGYFILFLHRQMEEGISLPTQVAYWSGQLLRCNRIGSQGLAWRPALLSAKESVTGIIQKEIDIHTALLPLAGSAGEDQAAGRSVGEPFAVTSLSVSQLAVLIRLLTDCSLIKCANQSALFKGLVGAVRTEKTNRLSAESLRSKYYSPERPAVVIVREYLLRMMNQIKELQ